MRFFKKNTENKTTSKLPMTGKVKNSDLISMEKSHCYNPFVYLQNDNDVQKLVTDVYKRQIVD